MINMKKTVYLYVNTSKSEAVDIAGRIKEELIASGYEVLGNPNIPADIVIGFGGDGTLIKWLSNNKYQGDTKYIGVNCGTVGFMQDFDVYYIKEFVSRIPEYVEQKLNFIEIKVDCDDKSYKYRALNEFYIKSANDKVFKARVKISDVFLEDFIGTGINFATPAGSTARNLSIGGSIIFPNLQVFEMTPSEPSTFMRLPRSIIIPKENNVTLLPINKDKVKILADGKSIFAGNFNKITIKLSDSQLTKLVDRHMNFVERIHDKFIEP